jgi:hypothetical protein
MYGQYREPFNVYRMRSSLVQRPVPKPHSVTKFLRAYRYRFLKALEALEPYYGFYGTHAVP